MPETTAPGETTDLYEVNESIACGLANLATLRVFLRSAGFSDEELESINIAQTKIREIRNSIFGIREE